MCHAVFHRMSASHQGAARWCACWAYHESRESCASVVQLVQVRSPDPWVSMTANRAIALVVSDDQDDVRFFRPRFIEAEQDAKQHGEQA